jgi:hypothetical protein
VAYLSSIPADAAVNAKVIETGLNKLISSEPNSLLKETVNQYGHETWFNVQFASDQRRLLSITSTFTIACGTDSLLLIFQPENRRWREVLKWQSSPYHRAFGALNELHYVVSPPDAQGRWYILASDEPASCSSCWGGLSYYTLRPAEGSADPNQPFRMWTPLYRCNSEPMLTANQADFKIRFWGRNSDAGDLIRRHVRQQKLMRSNCSGLSSTLSPRGFLG